MKQIAFKSSPSFSDYINDRYFKGTAISRPIMGTVKSVKRISAKTIKLWKNRLFSPSNSCFVITGNYLNEYNEYAKNILSSFLNINKPLNRYSSMPEHCFQRDDKSDFIIDTDYDISDISITFDVNSNNCFQAEFLSSIIGGGVGSRLALILREDLAITDEVYSNVDIFMDISKLNIEFSTDNSNLESALKYTFKEIVSLKEKILENDIEQSKIFFTENQNWFLDDSRELNFLLGWRGYVLGQPVSDINSVIKNYLNISPVCLLKASQEIFRSSNLIITVTNNKSILKRSKLKETVLLCRNLLNK